MLKTAIEIEIFKANSSPEILLLEMDGFVGQ